MSLFHDSEMFYYGNILPSLTVLTNEILKSIGLHGLLHLQRRGCETRENSLKAISLIILLQASEGDTVAH